MQSTLRIIFYEETNADSPICEKISDIYEQNMFCVPANSGSMLRHSLLFTDYFTQLNIFRLSFRICIINGQ